MTTKSPWRASLAGCGLDLQGVLKPWTDSRLTGHLLPWVSSFVVGERKGIPKKGILL